MGKCHKYTEKIKPRKVKTIKLDAKCSDIKHIHAKDICTESLKAKTFILDDVDVNCLLTQPPVSNVGSNFDPEVDGVPSKPEDVNQEVFDALLTVSETARTEYQTRWNVGRTRLGLDPKDVEIVGYKTQVPYVEGCGVENQIVNFLSSMSFDFEIANPNNDLNDILMASIYIQMAWIDQTTTDIIIAELQIGNRQFQASIDWDPLNPNSSFGEKFNGTLALNTNLIKEAFTNMPDLNNTAAIQLVLYAEEGLEVFTPASNQNRSRKVFDKNTRSIKTRNLFDEEDDDFEDEYYEFQFTYVPIPGQLFF